MGAALCCAAEQPEAPQQSSWDKEGNKAQVKELKTAVPVPEDVVGLVSLLTDPTSSDKQLASAVANLTDITRASDEHRSVVGSAAALQRLATMLIHSSTPAILATAEVFRNVAFNRQTHKTFQSAQATTALVHQLHHETYRVTTLCLCALRNLSVTPSVVLEIAKHKSFLSGVKRFLLQKADGGAQMCAAQLLLNICGDSNAPSKLSTPEVIEVLISVLTADHAQASDRETRDMCSEALVSLIERSDDCLAEFRKQGGLAALLNESKQADVLASTQVTICEALDIFIKHGYASEILAADISPALIRMLTAETGADDRVMSSDAKLAALQLVGKLCEHADARQQLQLAHQVVPHFAECLESYSMSLQLAVCHLLVAFLDNAVTRPALIDASLTPALVSVHEQQACLPSAPIITCIGRLCELDRSHADTAVRCNGLKAMLETLENSTIAQAQRHALVAITQVLRHASPSVLSPALQTGSTVNVAALVLQHTGSGQVSDQKQWVAWCCRVLADVAGIDDHCKAKVVTVISKSDASLLALLNLPSSAPKNAERIVPTLLARAEAADGSFLAKVVDSQLLAEAVAVRMVKGRHPFLKQSYRATGVTIGMPNADKVKDREKEPRKKPTPAAPVSMGDMTQIGSTLGVKDLTITAVHDHGEPSTTTSEHAGAGSPKHYNRSKASAKPLDMALDQDIEDDDVQRDSDNSMTERLQGLESDEATGADDQKPDSGEPSTSGRHAIGESKLTSGDMQKLRRSLKSKAPPERDWDTSLTPGEVGAWLQSDSLHANVGNDPASHDRHVSSVPNQAAGETQVESMPSSKRLNSGRRRGEDSALKGRESDKLPMRDDTAQGLEAMDLVGPAPRRNSVDDTAEGRDAEDIVATGVNRALLRGGVNDTAEEDEGRRPFPRLVVS